MESLPRPGRLWLALGLCAGVGLGATSAIAHEYLTREVPEPKIVVGNAPDGKNVYAKIEPDATGLQRAVVRTPWSAQTELVEDGDKVVVEWEHERLWCEEERPAYVIKRCPELGGDGAGSGDDARSYWSFAVIDVRAAADTKPTEGPAPANKRSLADELSALLLASGSVDGVFLVTADEGFAAVAAEHQLAMGSADQLLVVAPSVAEAIPPGFPGRFVVFDTAALRSLVVPWNFSGESTIAAVYPELAPLRRTEAAFRIRGFGACGRLDQPCCQDLPGSDIGWDGCSEALRCDRGSMTCVEPPPRCAFAKQRCDATGTRIEICLPNGSVVKQSCGDGRCVDGMCRPVICKQGATRCADRGEQRCVADGTAWEITRPCGREERCKGDRCVSVPQVFVEFLAVKLDVKRTKAWLRHFLECSVDGKPVLGMRLSEVQSGLKNRGAAVRGPDSFVVACSVAGSRMRDARKHKFVRSDIGRHTLELSDDRVELVVEYQVRPADLSVYKDIAPSK